MYCVIQEIELKKENQHGAYRSLEAYKNEFLIAGKEHISYSYRYTGDRFERPIRRAYKISIHNSYRENGKVKKKQWSVCTMSYYDLVENSTWIQDYMSLSRWEELIRSIGIGEEDFIKIVYDKLNLLVEQTEKEFQQTEEYKTHADHRQIIDRYLKDKSEFEKEYGKDTYDKYYDVFGVLREPDRFEAFKKQYEAAKEYQRSYRENFNSNYNNYSNSSYQNNISSNHKEDKKKYKELYKTLAKAYHPDKIKDDGEMMKLVNQLKEEWGL